jgi:hypothetical protein
MLSAPNQENLIKPGCLTDSRSEAGVSNHDSPLLRREEFKVS